jgi:hypothetical protein
LFYIQHFEIFIIPSTFLNMPIQKLVLLLRGSTRYDRKLDSAALSMETREEPAKEERTNILGVSLSS